MSQRPTRVPALPAPTQDNLLEFARAVKNVLDVREGLAGDLADSFVKRREVGLPNPPVALPPGTFSPGGAPPPAPPVDTTPPPAPTGLTAAGLFAMVQLFWDSPAITNLAYTEIWVSDTDLIGSAVLLGTSRSRFFAHSFGTGPVVRFYWIRFVTTAGIAGPYNATAGARGETSTDPGVVLNVLNSRITESELSPGLSTRVSLIDAAATVPGSVNSRILIESQTRQTEDSLIRQDLQIAQNATLTVGAALSTETQIRVQQNNARVQEITTLQLDVGTLDSSVTGLSSSVTTLSGALQTEALVRSNQTGQLFAQYTVKIDLAGHVSGYGLASTLNNAPPTSAFGVRSDQFWVAPPAVLGDLPPTTNLFKGKVWVDTSSPAPVTRYWDPATSTWTITPNNLPFTIQTTPVTLPDGTVVEPGTYIDTAMIRRASITSAQIRDLRADKITAGYTASVDLESGVFVGSEFYIGGVVTYNFDPQDPTKRIGIASVSGANVAINNTGVTLNVDYFRVINGNVLETPFEISGGVVRAKRANIEDLQVTSAKIANVIRSQDFDGVYSPGSVVDSTYGNAVLLLHCDTDAIFDNSPASRSPVIRQAVSLQTAAARFGAGSLLGGEGPGFVGPPLNSRLVYDVSPDFALKPVYTLEFFIRREVGNEGFLMARSATSYGVVSGDGNLSFTGICSGVPTIPLVAGFWHHVAVASDGSTVRFFRDGQLLGSYAPLSIAEAQAFAVFGVPARPDIDGFSGALDEIRYKQDVCLYTAAFVPPSAPFPDFESTPGTYLSRGTRGWSISKGGDVVFNSLFARGSVAGGQFQTDNWGWPLAGGGYHVGAQGIRLGREASGAFFEVSAAGEVRAPGFALGTGGVVLSSGLLRNTANTAYINLGAAGSEDFLWAGDGKVRIKANGDAFFGAEVLPETSWFGSLPIVVTETSGGGGGKSGGGQLTTTTSALTRILHINTGIRVPLFEALRQSYSARAYARNGSGVSLSGAVPGNFMEAVLVDASISIATPFFWDPFTIENPGQNPYGTGNVGIYVSLRVSMRPEYADTFTSFVVTHIRYIVDRIA